MKPYASYKPSGVPWLGDVPGHWSVKQTRFVMTCNDDVLPEYTNPEQVLDYIEISDVDEMYGIKGCESVKFSDAPSRARRLVMDGDVIVSTVRTYLRAVAAISNPTAEAVVSTGFAVLRPRDVNSRFAKYAILYDGFISEVISRSKGISYPAINATDLVRISVPLPPPDEQQAIADYLDLETARIDNLNREKNELMDLLKEWRQSVIAEAVTKGLDKTAVMKPSGVAWLGEVPGHWDVKQTRFVMTCNDDVLPEHTSPEQLLDYVEISDVDEMSGIKGFETVRFVDAPSRARRLVVDGDVIVSTVRTYLRAVAAISNPTPETVVSTGFAVLRPRSINSRFAKYAILCDGFISEVIARSKGISYPAINATDLVRIAVPLPPSGEQRAIADYLDTETGKIDGLIAHTNDEITLLKELRAATIADAVLGRVDVRTAPKK